MTEVCRFHGITNFLSSVSRRCGYDYITWTHFQGEAKAAAEMMGRKLTICMRQGVRQSGSSTQSFLFFHRFLDYRPSKGTLTQKRLVQKFESKYALCYRKQRCYINMVGEERDEASRRRESSFLCSIDGVVNNVTSQGGQLDKGHRFMQPLC